MLQKLVVNMRQEKDSTVSLYPEGCHAYHVAEPVRHMHMCAKSCVLFIALEPFLFRYRFPVVSARSHLPTVTSCPN